MSKISKLRRRTFALCAATIVAIYPTASPVSAATRDVVAGHGADATNRNVSTATRLTTPLSLAWHRDLPRCPSAATNDVRTISVGGGSVYTVDAQYQCGFLSAYADSNGALRWRLASHFSFAAVYHAGTVFWIHYEGGINRLTAVNAATGTVRWTTGVNSRAVVAAGSTVISGDTAYDTRTGKVRWQQKYDGDSNTQAAIAAAWRT